MRMYLRRRVFAVATLATLVIFACVVSTTNRAVPLYIAGAEQWVSSPIKAHLTDGSVVLFRNGANVGGGRVRGAGIRFSPTLDSTRAEMVTLDSVVGVEAFEQQVNPVRTLVYAPVTGVASVIAAAALAVAIFGSCPTIYADSAGTPVLQAESFSYSIAPLLAKRDVDRLNVTPDSNGIVRLEVRNEALETHYVDQFELLETRHRADEVVMPAARSGLVAVRSPAPPASIVDSRGRDVKAELSAIDERVFATSDSAIALGASGMGPTEEFLEITLPRPAGRDSLAVVLNMRSSLLSTTVFYEHMLARPGARSLDWIGRDLSHITTVAQVAKWYTDHFGLRVSVRDGDGWKPVVRLLDFGPAAWRTVAAIVPAHGDSVRIRLTFVADEFRIDRVATSWNVRSAQPRLIHAARVTASDGRERGDVREFVRSADDRRLVTSPGDRFFMHFDVGKAPQNTRTFLLAADGYYVEWVRPSWIAEAREAIPFSAKTTTQDILRSWVASKSSLESRFFRDRVPVQ